MIGLGMAVACMGSAIVGWALRDDSGAWAGVGVTVLCLGVCVVVFR
jgi:hypothetical protein